MFNFDEELPPVRTGYLVTLLSIAAIVVIAAIGAYAWWGRIPPASDGQIMEVTPFQVHQLAAADIAPGNPGQAPLPFLILAKINVENIGKKSLSLSELSGVITVDNVEYKSLDVNDVDFSRVFQHYPELSLFEAAHIPNHTTIAPGTACNGLLVLHFPITMEQWNRRNSFQIVVSFSNSKDLVLADASSPNQGE